MKRSTLIAFAIALASMYARAKFGFFGFSSGQ